jgi:hypothetical protein
MTLQEAIEYLRYYQSWKLDKQHQLLNPKKTTKALDMVLDAANECCAKLFVMKIEPNFDDLKGWYSLNLAELPLGKEIKELKFDEFWQMREFLEKSFKKKKDDRVYLYKYGGLENPIIISCNPFHILKAHSNMAGFREHHIHEYSSYDDAYKFAKDMMEEHPLCYS